MTRRVDWRPGSACRPLRSRIWNAGCAASGRCSPSTPRSQRRSTTCCRQITGRASPGSSTTARLPDQQCRRKIPPRRGPRQEVLALRRVRARRAARRLHVFPDRHRKAERHRPAGLARRRHRPHLRYAGLAPARVAAVGMAPTYPVIDGSRVMARVTHVYSIDEVARRIGESLELIELIRWNDDNIDYGEMIRPRHLHRARHRVPSGTPSGFAHLGRWHPSVPHRRTV